MILFISNCWNFWHFWGCKPLIYRHKLWHHMTLIGILFLCYLSEFYLFKVKNDGTNRHYVWPQSGHKSSENLRKSHHLLAELGVIFSHPGGPTEHRSLQVPNGLLRLWKRSVRKSPLLPHVWLPVGLNNPQWCDGPVTSRHTVSRVTYVETMQFLRLFTISHHFFWPII